MIKFIQGNIFESEAQTLVATVNCVGVMGKGLAKEFKLKYPEMFKQYLKACKKGELRKGHLFLYKDLFKNILCFPTKDNWKGPSKYEFIEEGLNSLKTNYSDWGIKSLAIPPLGCGLGGLEWAKVRSLIKKYLENLPINIFVYEPLETGERIPSKNPFRKWDKVKLTPASVYTGEMIRIARKEFPKSIMIGRLLLQKIAFFSQMAGLPIKLQFKEYKLGPYDYKMKFNVDRLEGLFVRDASPTLKRSDLIMLNEEEWDKALEEVEINLFDARERIERSVRFLKSMSLLEIELSSTVFLSWSSIVSRGQLGSKQEITDHIENWKPGKFSFKDISESYDSLTKGGWMDQDSGYERADTNSNSESLLNI